MSIILQKGYEPYARLRVNGMITSTFVASQTSQGRGETACENILLEHVWFACRNISYRRLCIHHSCNLTHQGTKMKEVKQVTQIEGHTNLDRQMTI